MSQATDLLNSLTDAQISAYSTGAGEEAHIVIGSDRFIKVPNSLKRIAVQYDHDVETVTFDCPRFWDDLDMSKMAVYINYALTDGYMDSYPVSDVTADGDIMHFTWTISRNVTQVVGNITFLVCVKKTDSEGVETNHWNSEICRDMYVSEGMETEEQIAMENTDLITQLLLRMSSVEQINVTSEIMDEYVEEITTARDDAAVTLEGINNSAAEIRNSYANAIKGQASGEIIRVDDVSPLEHDVKVKVRGKNLFDISKIFTTDASASVAYISEVGSDYILVTTNEGYTGNGFCTVSVKLRDVCPCLEVGKTYVLSATTESNSSNIYFPGISKSWVFGTTMIMTEELLNSVLTFYGLSTLHNMGTGTCRISNIQIEEGSVVTTYEPYLDPTGATVMARGKNVLRLSGDVTQNGVTKTIDANGLITVKGTSTSSININVGLGFLKAGYKYRPLIQKIKSDVVLSFWNFQTAANINKDKDGYISSDVDAEFSAFVYTAAAGTVYDAAFKVMVELVTDTMTDEYEPYKGSEAVVESPDGACTVTSKSPTMTLFTDTPGAIVEAEYNRDTTKMFESYVLTDNAKNEIAGLVKNDVSAEINAIEATLDEIIALQESLI